MAVKTFAVSEVLTALGILGRYADIEQRQVVPVVAVVDRH
jgi:hypothetical protein